MPSWESFLEQFGPWIGLGLYVFIKDFVPIITTKLIPHRLQELEDERQKKFQQEEDDRQLRIQNEKEHLAVIAEISKNTTMIALNMTQTNERIATMMVNQQAILQKQDNHHNSMMEAVADMRASVAARNAQPRPSQ